MQHVKPGAMNFKKKVQKLTKRRCDGIDTPWIDSMSNQYKEPPPSSSSTAQGLDSDENHNPGTPQPTVAPFSPNQQTASSNRTHARSSSVLIHQKSPLLVATPPQVTRALAYSHSFILPLNHVAGLLSWTTGDAWESFLLVAAFWFAVLYGDNIVRWGGPLVLVVGLIAGMYSRRYSPLSSTVWSGDKKSGTRQRADSEQRKSLDEILDTLQTFTSRCEVLLDPFLRLTEFLSTQSSATAATTRPALTTLFIRILALTPFWIVATLAPLRFITTQRVVLVFGTLGLSWHSRPARVTRTILWRSRTVRRIVSLISGLHFAGPSTLPSTPPPLPARKNNALRTTGTHPGVRFTFTLYENQRRWLGLGWTPSLLAYERQAWSDEHLNTCPEPDFFTLPDTETGTTEWQWVPGSEWHVEGSLVDKEKSAKRIGGGGGGDDAGWTYYDNKWHDGRKVDGWGRYTRRRKWVRDAELVDVAPEPSASEQAPNSPPADGASDGDSASIDSTAKRKTSGWFGGGSNPGSPAARRRQNSKNKSIDKTDVASGTGSEGSKKSQRERDDPEDDVHTPMAYRQSDAGWDRSFGEGVAQGLS